MAKVMTSLRLDEELRAAIDTRGIFSEVVHRDLERLYELYRYGLRGVELSVDEACLLVDALNGTLSDVRSASLLWAQVEDACALDHLDQKWQVDGKGLVTKLENASLLSRLAIVDAAERVWHAVSEGDKRDFRIIVAEAFGLGLSSVPA